MADISAEGIPDFGNLLTSFSKNQANIANTQANTEYLAGPQTEATQAQAGLMGAQTGLVQQNTKKAAFEVQMMRQAMESMKNIGGQDEKSGEQSQSDPTEVGVASTLNHKGFVDPMGPPGLQNYINATAWVNPAEAQRAEEWRKTLVGAQTAKVQNEMNDIFQTATTLSSDDNQHPLQSLLSLKHGSFLNNAGQAIAQNQNMSPEEKDEAAKTAITSAAKYSHQYTGRETEYVGDEARDKLTKFNVVAPSAGPTAGEKIDIGKWSNTPQTVTIDNRETTIKPKDLGIKSYADLTKNKSIKFSTPPPGQSAVQSGVQPTSGTTASAPGAAPPGQGPGAGAPPTGPKSPAQARAATSDQGGVSIPGLKPDQSDFVKQLPPGYPSIPSNQKPNPDDLNQRNIYREQSKKLSEATNTEFNRAQDTMTSIKQINTLLATPGITLGPGSHEYSQFRTILENWTGTPSGQAAAYQVLSKVLNASEMNGLLQEFHSEGAQVRLGAYESRLIMEKLAANPNLTKGAIQQMLSWQQSGAQYTMDKAKVAGAALQTHRDISNFDKQYGEKYPQKDLVDTTAGVLHGGKLNFSGASGKTYTAAEVSQAAAKQGIPLVMFQDQLTKAGATIK